MRLENKKTFHFSWKKQKILFHKITNSLVTIIMLKISQKILCKYSWNTVKPV